LNSTNNNFNPQIRLNPMGTSIKDYSQRENKTGGGQGGMKRCNGASKT
jgi:hypothetical protein